MNQKQLRLNYKKPTVATDGQSILINDRGPVTIAFFQIRGESPEALDADVVASVRLHSVAELEQLEKVIKDTLAQHKNREK